MLWKLGAEHGAERVRENEHVYCLSLCYMLIVCTQYSTAQHSTTHCTSRFLYKFFKFVLSNWKLQIHIRKFLHIFRNAFFRCIKKHFRHLFARINKSINYLLTLFRMCRFFFVVYSPAHFILWLIRELSNITFLLTLRFHLFN